MLPLFSLKLPCTVCSTSPKVNSTFVRVASTSSVDVLLAIGTSLGDLATDGFSPHLQAPRAMIHADIDARQIGKSYSPTHAIVASKTRGNCPRWLQEGLAQISEPRALRRQDVLALARIVRGDDPATWPDATPWPEIGTW